MFRSRLIAVSILLLAVPIGLTGIFAFRGSLRATELLAVLLAASILPILYWGFAPIVRERRRVEQVVESSLGVRSWASQMATGRAASSELSGKALMARIVIGLVLIAMLLAALARFAPRWALWLVPVVLLAGTGLWNVIRAKTWSDRIAEIGSTVALLLVLSGDHLFPYSSIWGIGAGLGGVVALALWAYWKTERDPARAMASARDAYKAGNYDLAIERARQFYAGIPLDKYGELTALALAHYRRMEFDRAESIVRAALSVQGEGRRAAMLAAILACILMEKQQYEDAQRALDTAAELDASNPYLSRTRAALLLRQGREPERALALADSDSIDLRAWALAECGRHQEALEALANLSLALKSKPELAEAAYYAGRAALQSGDREQARSFFEKAIEAEPSGLFGQMASREKP